MSTKKERITDSAELFEEFTGHEADSMEAVEFDIPDVVIEIGTADGIMYTTVRDGKKEKYIHRFKKKSRPLLAVSSDGKQLMLIGGSYQFTEKGIEDT
ncbi:MAG: hypothetical protein ABW166_04935 [Sedimenticola sp.]